jgi:hypothetical protein
MLDSGCTNAPFFEQISVFQAALIPKISGGTFWQGLDVSNFFTRDACQGITNKLLFIMAIAPGLFGLRALTKALIHHDLSQLAEVSQVLNLIG